MYSFLPLSINNNWNSHIYSHNGSFNETFFTVFFFNPYVVPNWRVNLGGNCGKSEYYGEVFSTERHILNLALPWLQKRQENLIHILSQFFALHNISNFHSLPRLKNQFVGKNKTKTKNHMCTHNFTQKNDCKNRLLPHKIKNYIFFQQTFPGAERRAGLPPTHGIATHPTFNTFWNSPHSL